jgi:hypothetical protein
MADLDKRIEEHIEYPRQIKKIAKIFSPTSPEKQSAYKKSHQELVLHYKNYRRIMASRIMKDFRQRLTKYHEKLSNENTIEMHTLSIGNP